MNRYLITATLRNDGTSRFSKDNRWGLFPSVALGWKIKEEGFMKDVDAVSDLKLRLGYGITGQQDISQGDYPYMATYFAGQDGAYYQFGDQFVPIARPDGYNPNLKWEETTTWNAGFDFGFFLILENWITPASSYMGTPSTNLPAGTTGDSPRTFRYEFDGTGRVTSAYEEEWELHYEIFYGEQEMQEYPKPVL